MARQTFVNTVDDLTREEGAQEHSFALDGWLYDIDLTDAHWREITSFMQRYVDAAPNRPRRIQTGRSAYGTAVGRPVAPGRATNRTPNDPAQNKAVRAWVGRYWREAGLRQPNEHWLAGKGSIPPYFREAYEKHQGMAPRPDTAAAPAEEGQAGGQDSAPEQQGRPVTTVPAAAFSADWRA